MQAVFSCLHYFAEARTRCKSCDLQRVFYFKDYGSNLPAFEKFRRDSDNG